MQIFKLHSSPYLSYGDNCLEHRAVLTISQRVKICDFRYNFTRLTMILWCYQSHFIRICQKSATFLDQKWTKTMHVQMKADAVIISQIMLKAWKWMQCFPSPVGLRWCFDVLRQTIEVFTKLFEFWVGHVGGGRRAGGGVQRRLQPPILRMRPQQSMTFGPRCVGSTARLASGAMTSQWRHCSVSARSESPTNWGGRTDYV